jgi:uncharacterized protein (TIGR02646 family)
MRHVVKGSEPTSFSSWKDLDCDDWHPTYGNLQNPQKQQLHLALIDEQGGTCCYCGREINLLNSHIEHFWPQRYVALALLYENLFASCIREVNPTLPVHCGHLKDDWFDESNHISPRDASCEQQFTYTADGQILPTSGAAAEMLEVLGLDNDLLQGRRKAVLAAVFDPMFISTATQSELHQLRLAYGTRRPDGSFLPFFHVVTRYSQQL